MEGINFVDDQAANLYNQLQYDTGPLSSGSHIVKVKVKGQKYANLSDYFVDFDYVDALDKPATMERLLLSRNIR